MIITQQPGKLHRDVLSEFNNRIIMRVNERASLALLEQTYVGGMQGRYDGALTFDPGDALVEGACLIHEIPTPPTLRAVHFKMGQTKRGGRKSEAGLGRTQAYSPARCWKQRPYYLVGLASRFSLSVRLLKRISRAS